MIADNFNKHILDCNPINDSILLNHIECNKLKTEKSYTNMYLDSSTKIKHVDVNKKTIEEKFDGKYTKINKYINRYIVCMLLFSYRVYII